MSLQPQPPNPIPEETARVAHAAFPQANTYMRMRDHFGALFSDDAFAPLFPTRGQPAEAPARLAFITILQFAEGLSDSQAATAVRARIDWKYALGLELTDSGFDASVLASFERGWWLAVPNSNCWIPCSRASAKRACSKRVGNSAPTRPMCSVRSVP